MCLNVVKIMSLFWCMYMKYMSFFHCIYLVGVVGFVIRDDVGHEGTVLNVFIITHDMDGVLARFSGPVPHVTRPVILIFTLDPGLRRTLNGEAYRKESI